MLLTDVNTKSTSSAATNDGFHSSNFVQSKKMLQNKRKAATLSQKERFSVYSDMKTVKSSKWSHCRSVTKNLFL